MAGAPADSVGAEAPADSVLMRAGWGAGKILTERRLRRGKGFDGAPVGRGKGFDGAPVRARERF